MSKIHQLPMGARFEYEGEEYVKTGPLFATGKGGQRLIPKYAVLRAVGEAGRGEVAVAPKPGALAREDVLAAFEQFHAQCRELVPADRQIALQAARETFLETLG